jgi:hypothetical protein
MPSASLSAAKARPGRMNWGAIPIAAVKPATRVDAARKLRREIVELVAMNSSLATSAPSRRLMYIDLSLDYCQHHK